MPDTKISGLTELSAAPADNDLLTAVDVSDTSMASTGTNKKIQYSNIAAGVKPTIWSVRSRSYNAIDNPNFEIDQRWAGTTTGGWGISAGDYNLDRWWAYNNLATGRFSNGQVFGSSPVIPGTTQYTGNCFLRLTVSTQQASLAAGESMGIGHTIEGCNARELYGGVHSLSLLVRSSVANLKFSASINAADNSKSLVNLCTLGAANTWTLITLPNLPVWDAGATWSSLAGVGGYYITIMLGLGSTRITSTLGSWITGDFVGASGMDNFVSKSVGSTFDIAYVQHEPGPECTTFIDIPFNQNYEKCLRYFQQTYNYGTLPGTAILNGAVTISSVGTGWGGISDGFQFVKRMAKAPTVTSYDHIAGGAGTCRGWYGGGYYGLTIGSVGTAGFSYLTVTPVTITNDFKLIFHYSADCAF